MIYLLILILLLLLSFRYDINGKTEYRDFWYHFVLVVLIFVAGLRYRLGIDTVNYLDSFYHKYPYIWDINMDYMLAASREPLWLLFNSVILSLGGKFFILQFIQSTIVNIIIFRFFKKHSTYPFICILFYFISIYFLWNMVVMRSAVAMAIALVGNDYILDGKKKKAYFTYLIALLFHYSAIVLFVVPFLLFLRLNRKGLLILLSMFVCGFIIERVLGDYLLLLEFSDDLNGLSGKLDHYSGYLENDRFTGGLSMLRILPSLVYGLLSLWLVKKHDSQFDTEKYEPFLMIGLIFVVMQFGFTMSYRFVRFFEVYFILFEVQLFIYIFNNSRRLTKALSLGRTILIFSPLFLIILYQSFYIRYSWYVPYSSVINRSIDKNREKMYNKYDDKPAIWLNEY